MLWHVGLAIVALTVSACGEGAIGGTPGDARVDPGSTGNDGIAPSQGPTLPEESTEPPRQPAPGVTETFYVTRTTCMRPCAVQLDAQKGASLSWPEVRDSEYIWDFDDGGSRTDSEGFLAAAVYEWAGTYEPTLTIDGETWNPQSITVLDPTRTVCVGSDFTDCPSVSGGDHFATLSSALQATNGEGGRHVLLERGGSYGALPDGNATPTMIGAYGTGAKPIVTAGISTNVDWAYVDLDVRSTGGNVINGGLLLRVEGSGPGTNWIFTTQGIFVVDSSIVVTADYPMQVSDNTPWLVVKNSTINRLTPGQHTIRIDGPGQEKILIQNSQILGSGSQDSLTIRGESSWILVQGNFFDQHAGTYESQPGDPRLQQKIVWERNTYDRQNGNTGIDWGFSFQGHDMIVRNNVVYNNGGQFQFRAVDGAAGTRDIWFVNNTALPGPGADGFRCGNTAGCVLRNNLVYRSGSLGNCLNAGGTRSNNWCFSSDDCIDPLDAGSSVPSDCFNPNFISMSYGHADFLRPSSGTRGIDVGYPTMPVWNDYDNADRATIDVGAVER